jgi:phenylacetate-coenzyme A ligase PaaK-like adenylate-forming protein
MAGQDERAAPLDRSEPIETASLDELRALQLKRLKQTIARATLVPQYHKKFAAAGVASTISKPFRSRPKRIFGRIIRSVCSPCR